ncbi:MAG: bifunctional diaminohydroxyphosphoribosylaminopyrimidine deaminase/5-amino-6-(5-phosphoribosylamino)uracil reductase RibD [Bacteroidales bacterium]|nr:bifunctional diaminohydroxyphosphoribosylaminopyrimidine deaminase/5-amino-6-(5-phosphoribosylamino)uracil reductase RibD [Bacteroidales bacterium]
MRQQEIYINRCIELAKQALGSVAPNPMVGALLVYKDSIIGEGFHKSYGSDHAEAAAIKSVRHKSLLKDSELYVNLEPCSHQGKTPACSELIVKSGIPKVIIGSPDPNPLVAGKGIRFLVKNGVEVLTGISEESCIELNRRFFMYHIHNRPYVILKWAQTMDGFIDVIRKPGQPVEPNWISNELSRILVHKWRSEEQAIMVGTNTVKYDDPMLNTREWCGNNPVRIILDKNLSLKKDYKIFNSEIKTLIINEKKSCQDKNFEFIRLNFTDKLIRDILRELFIRNIQSVIIEGGKMLIESFISANLWDEARIFIGNKKFHQGIHAPIINNKRDSVIMIENDQLIIHKNSDNYIPSIARFLQKIKGK